MLPDIALARIGVWLVMHEDLRRTRRVRLVFDHLAAALGAYLEPGGHGANAAVRR